MAKKRRVKIPPVTVPATVYLVKWVDANHEVEYDGPSVGFEGELIEDRHVGFHVQTKKDSITLASSCTMENDENNSRWHLTVPRIHITAMIPWGENYASEESGSGEVGKGGVSGGKDASGEVRGVRAPRKGVHEVPPEEGR
jgi:hypothetical protein